jgi:hypothetical protein
MGSLHTLASALLGLAYASVLAVVALWFWARRGASERIVSVMAGVGWAALALLAGHVVAESAGAVAGWNASPQSFATLCALGALAATQLWAAPLSVEYALPFAVTLVILAYPVLQPAAAPNTPATARTLLYSFQGGLHALGIGALIAAAPSWYGRRQSGDGALHQEVAGFAALGVGLGLSSAWAWLNTGLLWPAEPRLTLFLGAWVLLLGGLSARRMGRVMPAAVCRGVAVVVILFAVLGESLYGPWWAGLALPAW